jgi:hypothetical protein
MTRSILQKIPLFGDSKRQEPWKGIGTSLHVKLSGRGFPSMLKSQEHYSPPITRSLKISVFQMPPNLFAFFRLHRSVLLIKPAFHPTLQAFRQATMFSKLSFFRSQSSTSQPVKPIQLPLDIPIEEECFPEYHPHHFYHANPGEVLDGRFELKVKLGYGCTSTVWLAEHTT